MKKVLSFVAVIATVASLSSCSKDYTCECTILGFTSSETQNMKKKDAKEWCDEANTNAEVWGGSCSLQ
jgi:hypothetical protein